MERVIKVRKKFKGNLKAITHLDQSARVHTVSKRDNLTFIKF